MKEECLCHKLMYRILPLLTKVVLNRFLRMIEKLILQYRPTMLIVDHDIRFREKIATKVYEIEKG